MLIDIVDMRPETDLFSPENQLKKWGWAFHLEHRGLPTATPLWMMLSSRQLHEGAHLHPVLQHLRHDVALAVTREHSARPRRDALHLPTTIRKE